MKKLALFLALVVLVLFAIACGAPAAPAPTGAPPGSGAVQAIAPTSAPAATSAALAPRPGSTLAPSAPQVAAATPGAIQPVSVVDAQRRIIKNANFNLTVENTDSALDRATGIAADMGGYIISTRTFFEQNVKGATITFAVPVERFEETLRRVRAIAIKVDQESASGQDVTDQYADLESQIRNLEATSDRIRDFLKKANTVEEALKVNQQLADVEKQIETAKGRLNFLGGRSAFSTVTIEIRQQVPTPTITRTPTITATPTPTMTPTPFVWKPGETFDRAVETQGGLLRGFAELAIWLIVVFLPYVLVFLLGVWLVVRIMRWMQKRPSGPKPPAP